MEVVIVICLLIVIVLLARDKIVIKNIVPKNEKPPYVKSNLPEIMGVPKPKRRLSVPNTASDSQNQKPVDEIDNLDSEIEEKDFNIQISQEELDEVFGYQPDFEEEEEEWRRYRDINGDDSFGLATGVTFEELAAMESMLQQEILEPFQQKEALQIVQKIQGTELFSLLENSMENASGKIAKLLDRSLNQEMDSGSSIMRNNDLGEFDVREFV